MLKNFLIVAIRSLGKNRLYSIINISGLSVGFTCSLLILLWVADETSFDSFHPKADRLYQVWGNAEFDGKINSWRSVPLPTYEALKDAHSGIANTTVADWGGNHLLKVGEKRMMQQGYYVGEEFLEMFEFPLLVGDAATVLDDPSSIVITTSLAKSLFGDADPMGQVIRVDDKSSLKVTGILKDIPNNSSFELEYLMTWKHREAINPWVVENKTNWGNYSFQVYVELVDATKREEVVAGIENMLYEHGETELITKLFLHPLLKWRLYSSFENGKITGGMSDYVRLFTAIAIFILVIACINFMNLSTARSERRAREVGIRKSLGSRKGQLIAQFLGESLFLSMLSFFIAVIISLLVLPAYNNLVEKELVIDFTSSQFWIYSIVVVFVTGILSGSYPAFYLSSFNPVRTLKGSFSVGKSGATPRKVLVIIQFAFAIMLMISTVVIFKQIELAKNRELGYKQENLITIQNNEEIAKNYYIFKEELEQSGYVESVTRSNSAITDINSNNFLGWPGKPETQRVIFTTIACEYDYAKTMGIEMLMGRDFSKEFTTDTASIVINKAALDLMGLEDPLGTPLDLWGGKRKLIGVVDNVMMGSPYDPVKPMFMILDPNWTDAITVRLKATDDLQGSLAVVGDIFNKHNPAYPFEYTFVDVEFQKKFTTINMTQRLATIFSFLTIFITGLGLFGLASFTAEQRIKEIGVRKVLGASVFSLVALISKDFTKLVLIAFAVSAPMAWYLLSKYLERYTIHTNIDWWIFPLVGIVALGFALAIVSDQARRAALTNPARSLRSE
ncbi:MULTISPECIES: ABC transporter permease [unclassified Imperialibacter]|uniref:ABC transporter permease n=1 Tax=unclassified Imperialibacter TaxID=2629706 RepID=UPI001251047F|nr:MULTISPECIES: ABC transporter permease [unclassified Imperialibacter]CAD5250352.1 conserved membrane hypothetical protein [Imperialibacter sp. 75]CAD5287253.1 conserved membrane hypothetical protein [Imperialibacter sp. 89]VVT06189.1 conserved membrane hypothetical protein [Imperialibacter sp. EC-SDR9]